MAILNKIRQRSLFLILVIAMALFSFVLADLFRNSGGFSSKDQNVVASINGEDINREDFMAQVENLQRQYGSSRSSTQVMNMVYDREVRKAVLNAQYDALGLSIERDKMRSLLEQSFSSYEEFKNEDGVYDENKLNEFIANLKQFPKEVQTLGNTPINFESWTNFEADVAQRGKEDTYFNMVKAGVMATLTDGELDYRLENDNVDIKYVQIPFSSIQDSTIQVSKSDITKYVNQHKSQFKVEESRDIIFVQFEEKASLEDEKNIEQELLQLLEDKEEYDPATKATINKVGFKNTNEYEEYLAENSSTPFTDSFVFKPTLNQAFADSIFNLKVGEVYGPYKEANLIKFAKIIEEKTLPDSAKVRHILIPHLGAARASADISQTEEEAKKTADSILAVIKRNRSKFPELVTEFSSDQGSIANGGEYDFHPYGTMVPEFNDFEFNGKKGDLGVVKTVFGFHIIEVLGQTEKSKALKLATLSREIEPSEKTIDNVFNQTSKFEIAVADKDFEEVAKENNYTVKPVNGIKVLDESIPGLSEQRAIVRWAFENESNESDVRRFNIPSGGFLVAKLVAKNKEGLMDTEKASVTALPAIRKEKKAQLIKERVAVTTLDEIATAEGQSVRSASALNMKTPTIAGAGREPQVVGAAFGLEEGETSSAIIGENGVYFVEVTKVTPAIELPSYQANANRLSTAKSSNLNTNLFNALKEAAEINDNRKSFY
ncbi:MAG: peptidylprolyl isomerase [Flavobacteriaceae bacterium]|nr:peptidylprolyl isomerase [Flavobacteriaceae bacterium]